MEEQNDPTASRRIEAEGAVYELRRWPFHDGRRWLTRLLKAAAGSASTASATGSEVEALAALLEGVSEELVDELWKVIEAQTSLVQVREGRETVVPLAGVAAVHMRGRYATVAILMREHLASEFSPFFAQIGAILGNGSPAADLRTT